MSDYAHEFYAWTQEQAEALRAKEWKTLDVENLADVHLSASTAC
jgi:hypothetical protein